MRPENPSTAEKQVVKLALGPAAYTDEGAGVPILALHGLPGSTRDFRWLAPCLAPGHRFIRVDLPGFGDTPMCTGSGYTIPDRARFVLSLIDALCLERPLLVGHSIGGPVAIAAAVARPEHTRGVALINSVGVRRHPAFKRFASGWISRALQVPAVRSLMLRFLRRAFVGVGFPGRLPDDEIAHSIHYASATSFPLLEANCCNLRVPTLVAWSEDDHILPPDFSRQLADACPDGPRLAFKAGGHNLQMTRAVELAATITEWLPALD